MNIDLKKCSIDDCDMTTNKYCSKCGEYFCMKHLNLELRPVKTSQKSINPAKITVLVCDNCKNKEKK